MRISGKNLKGEQLSLTISREQFEETFKSVFVRRYNIIPNTIKIEKTWEKEIGSENLSEVIEEQPQEMLDTVVSTQSIGEMEEPQTTPQQVNTQLAAPSLKRSWKQSILGMGKRLQSQLTTYINNYTEWEKNQQ